MSALFKPAGIGSYAVTDKATQIMDKLLLTYLTDKPNMREFLLAFVAEMDYLMEQINEVYLGRFLENAVGEQLDVIGIILQQNRRVVLPSVYFGFQGATGGIAGMADENAPATGGIFRSGNDFEGDEAPLTDTQYKRLLLVKAFCMNGKTSSVNQIYFYIQTLLGRSPSYMELEQVNTAGSNLDSRIVILNLSSQEVTIAEVSLVTYASKYFVPAGTSFTIQVN